MANNIKANQDEEKKASAKRKASIGTVSQDTACNGANPKVDSPVTRRKIFATNNQTTNKPSPAVLALQQMDDALAEKVKNHMLINLPGDQHFFNRDCQFSKQELPSVICSKSTLQLRAVSIKDDMGKVIETQWRVVVEHISHPDSCLDADIGMVLTNCQGCVWETLGPQVKVRDLSISESALILRQDYFTTRRNGLAYFPKTITVSGRVYSLHRCQQETTYCYAVPYCESNGDFVFAAKTGSDAKYLIKISKAPMYGYRYCKTFEPKVNLLRGELIVATKYGEVYRASLHSKLPSAPAVDPSAPNTYDTMSSTQVAAKIVRHLNDHCGEVERVYCEAVIGAEKRYARKPNHHLGSEGLDAPLTTAHLSPFFEKQHVDFGTNEDVAREIEMMAFIRKHASSDLSRLLVPLADFAICPNNLYVISPYMPIKSLFHYKPRDGLNGRITEACAQHVTYQLLCALAQLHKLRIAHRDISVENVVFGAAKEKLQSILDLLKNEDFQLSDADFRQLEVKLIDLGQAVRHVSVVAPSGEPDLSAPLNGSFDGSFDTVTTTESALSPCRDADCCMSPTDNACSITRTTSTSNAAAPPSGPSTAPVRDYELLALGRQPVGKVTSMCPEHYLPTSTSYCGLCVDMWQVGMLIWCMVTGRPPFPCLREPTIEMYHEQYQWMQCVAEKKLAFYPVAVRFTPEKKEFYALREHVSDECLNLLEGLLQARPEERLTAEQALDHRWFHRYLRDLEADAQMK